jgi:hypothetical protein
MKVKKLSNIFHSLHSYDNTNNKYSSLFSNVSKSLNVDENIPNHYNNLLNLQKTVGNQNVQRLINDGQIQTKLKISAPSDYYEQEADRVAEQVTNGPYSSFSSSHNESNHGTGNGKITRMNSTLNPSGKPLDKQTRDYMEPRFGYDFSNVRIHADTEAASISAESLNASAYTVGNDIVFGSGRLNFNTKEGKNLLAHELMHIVQQSSRSFTYSNYIQRKPNDVVNSSVNTASGQWFSFRGFSVSDDAKFMEDELRKVIGRLGLKEADIWMNLLINSDGRPGYGIPLPFSGTTGGYGGIRPRSPIDSMRDDQEEERRKKIYAKAIPIVEELYPKVRKEAVDFLEHFQDRLLGESFSLLLINEQVAKSEYKKYGLTEKLIPPTTDEPAMVNYNMNEGSDSPGKELQKKAIFLMIRRRKIDDLNDEYVLLISNSANSGLIPSDEILEQINEVSNKIEIEKKQYNQLLSTYSSEYPILATIADLDKSDVYLEHIAEEGPGIGMADILGKEINEKITKIQETRSNLLDKKVNVWRLPQMVKFVKTQDEIKDDYMKNKLVEHKVEVEKDGEFQSIALGVLNALAIVFAASTAGLSLAAVAPLNIISTISSVQEYLIKDAMYKTAFDKARALSQEEPSLLWLGLEIVGTLGDVKELIGPAKILFKRLAPLVKNVKFAKNAEEAIVATDALRIASEESRDASFADRLIDKSKATTTNEVASLEVPGFTKEEISDLIEVSAKTEAESVKALGKPLDTPFGNLHISKDGKIRSCWNPCSDLENKYSHIFGIDGEISEKYKVLEKRSIRAAREKDVFQVAKIEEETLLLEYEIHRKYPNPLKGVSEDSALIQATKLYEIEKNVGSAKRHLPDIVEIRKNKPIRNNPHHSGVNPGDEYWPKYVDYYEDRLSVLEKSKKIDPKLSPVNWESYLEMRNMYAGGMEHQRKVTALLEDEIRDLKDSKLFKGMKEPIIGENIAVAGKNYDPTTKFADNLVIDMAPLKSGKKPIVISVSSKNRKFTGLSDSQVKEWVIEDTKEAFNKYGEEISLLSQKEEFKNLYGQKFKVDKVVLVYKLEGAIEFEERIRKFAAGTKVEVTFL